MSRYVPRRLRKPRPVTVLRYRGPHYLTNEMADQVRRQWIAARRRGVAVVSGDWDVLEVSR